VSDSATCEVFVFPKLKIPLKRISLKDNEINVTTVVKEISGSYFQLCFQV